MSRLNPIRIVVKALILFALANLAFAYFNPSLGNLTIFNHLVKGRLRFPAQVAAVDQYNLGVLSFQDMDEMFTSHVISDGPKPPDEYRVILLGDSSIWGYYLQPSEILSEQINKLNLTTCTGKTVRAYDLAYPLPSFMRDLLILDKAKEYQPDLIAWPVTMLTFLSNASDRSFLAYQSNLTLQLVNKYHLKVPAFAYLKPASFKNRTIIAQGSRINVVLADQLYGLRWAATDLDTDIFSGATPSNDVSSDTVYYGYNSPADLDALTDSFQFSALDAGRQLAAGTPVYFFNEPTFIANGANSSIRYNKYYPRWAYDAYRSQIGQWMMNQNLSYDDFWNAIPSSQFTNTPLHLTAEGESQLAAKLAPVLLNLSCK